MDCKSLKRVDILALADSLNAATFYRIDEAMKYRINSFLYVLALIDIRRHSPGIKELLQNNANLGDKVLQDLILCVCYAGSTASIAVEHVDKMDGGLIAKTDHAALKNARKSLKADDSETLLYVGYCCGGPILTGSVHVITKSMFAGLSVASDTVIPFMSSSARPWARLPAISPSVGDGRVGLAYILDDAIDTCLRDAHQHYRPTQPSAGVGSSSPRTVYDYVEQKIAAGILLPEDEFRLVLQ